MGLRAGSDVSESDDFLVLRESKPETPARSPVSIISLPFWFPVCRVLFYKFNNCRRGRKVKSRCSSNYCITLRKSM